MSPIGFADRRPPSAHRVAPTHAPLAAVRPATSAIAVDAPNASAAAPAASAPRTKPASRLGRLDERRQARDVAGLHVRFEDRDDLGPDPLRLVKRGVDEIRMRVYDGEPRARGAAEEEARARGRLVEEGPEDHAVSLGARR